MHDNMLPTQGKYNDIRGSLLFVKDGAKYIYEERAAYARLAEVVDGAVVREAAHCEPFEDRDEHRRRQRDQRDVRGNGTKL
eukprot:COSAG05_NODE_1707_length_4242_cov_9.508086_6_plen_81_part_00